MPTGELLSPPHRPCLHHNLDQVLIRNLNCTRCVMICEHIGHWCFFFMGLGLQCRRTSTAWTIGACTRYDCTSELTSATASKTSLHGPEGLEAKRRLPPLQHCNFDAYIHIVPFPGAPLVLLRRCARRLQAEPLYSSKAHARATTRRKTTFSREGEQVRTAAVEASTPTYTRSI